MDFTLTAYSAEILYSSLAKYGSDGYHDTAVILFMFLIFQKLTVNPLQWVFSSITMYHTQHASFRQQFTFRSSGPGNLIFLWFCLAFVEFIWSN